MSRRRFRLLIAAFLVNLVGTIIAINLTVSASNDADQRICKDGNNRALAIRAVLARAWDSDPRPDQSDFYRTSFDLLPIVDCENDFIKIYPPPPTSVPH